VCVHTERSLCRLIRRARTFCECLVGTYCACTWQTEDDSSGDDLITESVSVTPPSVAGVSLYSALFCVFMDRVRYSLEQRVFIYDYYVKTNSYKSRKREFRRKFSITKCPCGAKIYKLVKKVRIHGILIDRKPLKNRPYKITVAHEINLWIMKKE
jgi:hypothetical protein